MTPPAKVLIYRDNGRIVKCEAVSLDGERMVDLPLTRVAFDTPANTYGTVEISLLASRVRFIDRVEGSA